MTGSKVLVALFLSASVLVALVTAMEMRQSHKMQLRDHGAYAAPLDHRAENVLSSDGNRATCASKPMVTPNPNGTFTVQKEPPNGNCKDTKGKSGLVIPPQVVVPFFIRTSKKKQ